MPGLIWWPGGSRICGVIYKRLRSPAEALSAVLRCWAAAQGALVPPGSFPRGLDQLRHAYGRGRHHDGTIKASPMVCLQGRLGKILSPFSAKRPS
jgi:hypothetical protein